jgi:hypothetical protein
MNLPTNSLGVFSCLAMARAINVLEPACQVMLMTPGRSLALILAHPPRRPTFFSNSTSSSYSHLWRSAMTSSRSDSRSDGRATIWNTICTVNRPSSPNLELVCRPLRTRLPGEANQHNRHGRLVPVRTPNRVTDPAQCSNANPTRDGLPRQGCRAQSCCVGVFCCWVCVSAPHPPLRLLRSLAATSPRTAGRGVGFGSVCDFEARIASRKAQRTPPRPVSGRGRRRPASSTGD